jgi:hypothetical protein
MCIRTESNAVTASEPVDFSWISIRHRPSSETGNTNRVLNKCSKNIQLEIFRGKLLLQIQSFIFALAPSMKRPLVLTKYHNVDKLHRPTVQRYIWPIFSKELFSSRICLREAGYQLNLPLGLHNLWLVSSKILLILKKLHTPVLSNWTSLRKLGPEWN